MATCLFAPLRSEAAISDQTTGPQYLEDKVLFVHLGCHKLHANFPECVHGYLLWSRDGRWVA